MPDPSLVEGLDTVFVHGGAKEVMERSRLCLAASGTVTLECAIIGAPMVVVYNMNPLTVAIAKRLVNVDHFSLPNLIAGRRIVPELLQAGGREMADRALTLMDDGPKRETMIADLATVREMMGGRGASERAAGLILARLREEGRG